MLLPLHGHNPLNHIRFQYVTVAVIGLCVAVFTHQITLDQAGGAVFVRTYGAIPAFLFGERALPPELAPIPASAPVLTSMFLHGGFLHLIGNMLFLGVLGDNVEEVRGHGRYVAFYLVSQEAAACAHANFNSASRVPMIGASGAISGVIGTYLVLRRKDVLCTLVFRFIVPMRRRGVPLLDGLSPRRGTWSGQQ